MPITGIGEAAVVDPVASLVSALTAASAAAAEGSSQWLRQCAAAFSFAFTSISVSDTTTGLPTSAAVQWPDGTAGAFTGTISPDGNGYSGFVVTWVGSTTKTVTAAGITYDSNGTALGPTSLVVS